MLLGILLMLLQAFSMLIKDIAKIKTTIKNPILESVLEEKGKSTPEVWRRACNTFLLPRQIDSFRGADAIHRSHI